MGVVRAREALLFGELLAAKPPVAYREIKRFLRELSRPEDAPGDCGDLVGQFLEMWFSGEAQECCWAVAAGV